MIRFSHEANSWQGFSWLTQAWIDISVDTARKYKSNGSYIVWTDENNVSWNIEYFINPNNSL